MAFFLRFTLISYASIFFFTLGFRLALQRFDLRLLKLLLIFIVIATPLSFIFIQEPLQNRILISAVWTSVISIGFRVGRKTMPSSSNSSAEANA